MKEENFINSSLTYGIAFIYNYTYFEQYQGFSLYETWAAANPARMMQK